MPQAVGATQQSGTGTTGTDQRFPCILCGKTWLHPLAKPIGNMRVSPDKTVLCLRLLLEGDSIRSAERVAGINRNTSLALLETVGQRALRFWEVRMKRLSAAAAGIADQQWSVVRVLEELAALD